VTEAISVAVFEEFANCLLFIEWRAHRESLRMMRKGLPERKRPAWGLW